MSLRDSRRVLLPWIAFCTAVVLLHSAATAQQITYYDFDIPSANGQFSRACVNPTQIPATSANPLFCLNDGTGAAANPSFLTDLYPANVDPVTTDNPPVASNHTVMQMTPSQGGQTASMWFSVPQKISSGFTAYFAFRFRPDSSSFATADGMAFVIQNSAGGQSATGNDGTVCSTSGAGPTIVGVAGPGGCLGYGGIDNSLALELDTYQNLWDPNNNHLALQNCGAGLANSPDHSGSCLVNLNVNGAVQAAINSQLGVTLADGNVHEVVVEYSGPTEATPNQLQVFIDPPFVAGTHTPLPGTVPAIIGVYNIAAHLNLLNSGTANDSAYVGFTAATGGAFEQHELLAWTFTPHTPSTQQQPLSPPGQPTTFPFGSHTFTVTYPATGSTTSGIDMIVTANTITPAFFAQLSVGRPYAGAQCQVYDETGGNCIVYSASCVTHGTTTVVACPQATDPNNLIALKTAYNNTIQPTSPGFLQGDPLFTQITSIIGDGTTATVLCAGECAVTTGQVVTIGGTTTNGTPPASFDGTVTVLAADPNFPGGFTFSSSVIGTASSGYVASNNVQNIFTSYVPQRIDGTTAGKTKNFSDFVATSVTPTPPAAPTSLDFGTVYLGSLTVKTVTVTNSNSTPMNITDKFIQIVGGGNSSAFVSVNLCPATLAIGKTCNVLVAFYALPIYTPQTATLMINYGGVGSPQQIKLTAVVINPVASFRPSEFDFDAQKVGTSKQSSTTLINTGATPLKVTSVSVTGTNASDFVPSNNCPTSLAPGGSCTIGLKFTPSQVGNRVASLVVVDNAKNGSQQVKIEAKGK